MVMMMMMSVWFAVAVSVTSGLKIAITGSSRGIGLEAAKRLVKEGHTVYHACRSVERAEAAVAGAGGGLPLVCDLASLESVRSAAAELTTQCEGSLDVLCLNAGIAPSTRRSEVGRSAEGFEECIAVNHLGHYLLASLVEPCVSKANGVLCITASSVHDPEQPGGDKDSATLGDLSGLGSMDMIDGGVYSGSKVYKDSKLCNVLFAKEAVKRWPKVRVRAFNPGLVPTTGLFREFRKDVNFFAVEAFVIGAGLAGFAVPVEVGGARLAYMATADDTEVPPGSYCAASTTSKAVTKADGFVPVTASKEASNETLATELWDKSAVVVGFKSDGASSGLSTAELKKFGVAGTLAYVLTELAFWAVAFPFAAYTFSQTVGHAPDFSDNADRAAVLGYVFAGANVARLAVPLRFGAAFALAPWVDRNIVTKFKKQDDDEEPKSESS